MIAKNQTTVETDGVRRRMIAAPITKTMGPISDQGIHLQTKNASAGAVWHPSIAVDHGMKHRMAMLPKTQAKNIDKMKTKETGNRNTVATLLFRVIFIVLISSPTVDGFGFVTQAMPQSPKKQTQAKVNAKFADNFHFYLFTTANIILA